MSQNEIILIIRRTKDYWLKGEYRKGVNLNPCLSDFFDKWNTEFKMDIVSYRNRLRDIAARRYLSSKFDKIFLHSGKDTTALKGGISKEEFKLYKNSIFVPIDEDDWIDASLADEIRNVDTDKPFIIWDWYCTGYRPEYTHPKTQYSKFQSCAWACRGYEHLTMARNNLRVNHAKGCDCLNNPPTDYIHFINKKLVAKIDHPGSVGQLRKIAKTYRDSDKEWMEAVVKSIIYYIKRDLEWKHLYIEEWNDYKALLKELLSSYKYLTDEYKELL